MNSKPKDEDEKEYKTRMPRTAIITQFWRQEERDNLHSRSWCSRVDDKDKNTEFSKAKAIAKQKRDEQRRIRRNKRSKQRSDEKAKELRRILNKPSAERTGFENKFLNDYLTRETREYDWGEEPIREGGIRPNSAQPQPTTIDPQQREIHCLPPTYELSRYRNRKNASELVSKASAEEAQSLLGASLVFQQQISKMRTTLETPQVAVTRTPYAATNMLGPLVQTMPYSNDYSIYQQSIPLLAAPCVISPHAFPPFALPVQPAEASAPGACTTLQSLHQQALATARYRDDQELTTSLLYYLQEEPYQPTTRYQKRTVTSQSSSAADDLFPAPAFGSD